MLFELHSIVHETMFMEGRREGPDFEQLWALKKFRAILSLTVWVAVHLHLELESRSVKQGLGSHPLARVEWSSLIRCPTKKEEVFTKEQLRHCYPRKEELGAGSYKHIHAPKPLPKGSLVLAESSRPAFSWHSVLVNLLDACPGVTADTITLTPAIFYLHHPFYCLHLTHGRNPTRGGFAGRNEIRENKEIGQVVSIGGEEFVGIHASSSLPSPLGHCQRRRHRKVGNSV